MFYINFFSTDVFTKLFDLVEKTRIQQLQLTVQYYLRYINYIIFIAS